VCFSNRFKIDDQDPKGHFIWDVKSHAVAADHKQEAGPASPFDALVCLGQLPDNGILSNKLMNCFGQHVFDLLFDKVDYSRSLRTVKQITGIESIPSVQQEAHFSHAEQMELLLCWRLVHKFRILQETDFLHNQLEKDMDIQAINHKINALYAITNSAKSDLAKTLVAREREEKAFLLEAIRELQTQIHGCRSLAERNALLQQWQHRVFKELIARFQCNQGTVGLYESEWPFENFANTGPLQDAYYELQDHVFNERSPIHSSMIWKGNKGQWFHSAHYAQSQPEKLLFSATLIEECGSDLTINVCDFNAPLEHLSGNTRLAGIEEKYYQRKKEIGEKTLSIKMKKEAEQYERKKQGKSKLFKLPKTSRLLDSFFALRKTNAEYYSELKQSLNAFVAQHPPIPLQRDDKEESELKAAVEHLALLEEKMDSMPKDLNALRMELQEHYTIAPLSHEAFVPGDGYSATVLFLYVFGVFFDRDMMAKHPLVSLPAFTVPFVQFGAIAISSPGSVVQNVAQVLAMMESGLLEGSVSTQTIMNTIQGVNDSLVKFSHATTALKSLLVSAFLVSKVTYNVTDFVTNRLLFTNSQSALSEILKKYSKGSLENTTLMEDVCRYGKATVHLFLLGAMATALGVGADLSQSTMIEFFADVPLALLLHPGVQTLGAVKTSALLLGKMAGIFHYVKKGELLDLNNCPLKTQSDSWQIIQLFFELTQKKTVDEKMLSNADFLKLRRHFENLLAINPLLMQNFFADKITELHALGVKRVKSGMLNQMGMMSVRFLTYGLGFFVYGVPSFLRRVLTGKPMSPLAKLCLSVPLYWIARSALLLWTAVKTLFHPAAEIVLRLPEIAMILAFSLPRFLLYATNNWFLAIPLPAITTAYEFLTRIKNAGADGLRCYFRYPIKRQISSCLTFVRTHTIRRIEQWVQRALVEDSVKKPQAVSAIEFQNANGALYRVIGPGEHSSTHESDSDSPDNSHARENNYAPVSRSSSSSSAVPSLSFRGASSH